jgi:hypothetical protein
MKPSQLISEEKRVARDKPKRKAKGIPSSLIEKSQGRHGQQSNGRQENTRIPVGFQGSVGRLVDEVVDAGLLRGWQRAEVRKRGKIDKRTADKARTKGRRVVCSIAPLNSPFHSGMAAPAPIQLDNLGAGLIGPLCTNVLSRKLAEVGATGSREVLGDWAKHLGDACSSVVLDPVLPICPLRLPRPAQPGCGSPGSPGWCGSTSGAYEIRVSLPLFLLEKYTATNKDVYQYVASSCAPINQPMGISPVGRGVKMALRTLVPGQLPSSARQSPFDEIFVRCATTLWTPRLHDAFIALQAPFEDGKQVS